MDKAFADIENQRKAAVNDNNAEALKRVEEIDIFSSYDNVWKFSEGGNSYSIKVQTWRGYQESPFDDDEVGHRDITVTNLTTGESLQYASLIPALIRLYGFYEGKGTSYRVDPEQILRVFPFLISDRP